MATRLEIIKAEQAKLDLKMAKEQVRISAENLILAARDFKKDPDKKALNIVSIAMDDVQERMKEFERLTGSQLL